MLAVERRNKIEQMINQNGSVQVVELAKLFEVTTETIRGDLLKLEQLGILTKTYGGATLVENSTSDLGVLERDYVNFEEKKNIAKLAAMMINDGETIFLDSSTSAWHLARRLHDKHGLTVITNSLKVITELAECEGIRVICTGGSLNRKNMSYIGRVAEATIRQNYYVDKTFFSCRGVNLQSGLVDVSEAEAEIKRAMIGNSKYSVFLCDHTKFGKTGFAKVSEISHFNCMITNKELDSEWKDFLESCDIDVRCP